MRISTSMTCVLAICGCAGWALARSPLPIDPPTPTPCAADGKCYPNRGAWGWYQGRWRRWPGEELVPVPTEPTPAERLGPELQPTEIPSPELEDAAAPPSTTKKRPAGPAEAGAESPEGVGPETGSPTAPPSTSPLTPPYEAPPTAPLDDLFPDSTGDLDPPPGLPFAASTNNGLTSAVRSTGSVSAPSGPQIRSARAAAGDPPPAPPWTRSAAL